MLDPEVPAINVVELGVVREIELNGDELVVTVTPTYSGCPATEMIENDLEAALNKAGFDNVTLKTVLSPAWTTDWITDEARVKLFEYGIAPPERGAALQNKLALTGNDTAKRCPNCKSTNTVMVSQFGSTACKALYKCSDCLEPFDYFKCI